MILGRIVPSFRFTKISEEFRLFVKRACDNDELVRSILCRLERVGAFFMLDKNEMTCCFTGHRILPKAKEKQIFDKIREVVIGLIEKGAKYFGTGGTIGYETHKLLQALIKTITNKVKGFKYKNVEIYVVVLADGNLFARCEVLYR